MDDNNMTLEALMKDLAEKIKGAPKEKEMELRSFLHGYLAALEQMQPKTA